MYLIQLLAINFRRDALVKFQKAVMDNANGGPTDSNDNHLFIQLGEMIKLLSLFLTIVIKDQFFVTSRYAIKNVIYCLCVPTFFKTLSFLTLIDFAWNPLIEFLLIASFLDDTISLKCEHPCDTDASFIQQEFSDVGHKL